MWLLLKKKKCYTNKEEIVSVLNLKWAKEILEIEFWYGSKNMDFKERLGLKC